MPCSRGLAMGRKSCSAGPSFLDSQAGFQNPCLAKKEVGLLPRASASLRPPRRGRQIVGRIQTFLGFVAITRPVMANPTAVSHTHGFFFFFFFFRRLFIFGTERDRARTGEGQRERETQNRKQAPGSEPSAQSPTRGSNSRTARS